MFSDCLYNPLFSDVSIVLVGDSTDVVVPGHNVVLTRYAEARFGSGEDDRDRGSHTYANVGTKRKSVPSHQRRVTIVGWKDSLRSARDLLEFMYCAFDPNGEWEKKFFEECLVDPGSKRQRIWDLVCIADAYGVVKVFDRCIEFLTTSSKTLDDTTDWKTFFSMPESVLGHPVVTEWTRASLTKGSLFQRVYMQIAETCPLDLAMRIMESDDVRVWSEDVMLEFVLMMCYKQRLESEHSSALIFKMRVSRLTKTGLLVLAGNAHAQGPLMTFVHLMLMDEKQAKAFARSHKHMQAWVLPPRKPLEDADVSALFSIVVHAKDLVYDDTKRFTMCGDKSLKKHLPFVNVFATCWKGEGDKCTVGIFCKSTSSHTSVPGMVACEITEACTSGKKVVYRCGNYFTGRNVRGIEVAEKDKLDHVCIKLVNFR